VIELAANLCVLHPQLIGHVWPRVTPFLEAAFQHPVDEPEMTIEDARHRVEIGAVHLLYAKRGNGEITGAGLVEIIRYPRFTAAHVIALGGGGILDPWLREQFKQWAASHGATKMQAVYRPEVARLFRACGMKSVAVFGRGDL